MYDTATAFVSPSVLVVEDLSAAAVAVPVVVVVLLLVIGAVVLGMGLFLYFRKKGLRELIKRQINFIISLIFVIIQNMPIHTLQLFNCQGKCLFLCRA